VHDRRRWKKPQRHGIGADDDEIMVDDLTGVGIKGAAGADRVVATATEGKVGRILTVPQQTATLSRSFGSPRHQ
jgi:hypothetical protein